MAHARAGGAGRVSSLTWRAREVAFVVASLATVVACGGSPPPSSKVVTVGPTTTATPTPEQTQLVSATRPANVIAWMHLDNVKAWMLFAGVNQDKAPDEELMKGVYQSLEIVDVSRPFDAAATMVAEDDYEVAITIPIKDKQKFLDAVSKSADVTERKSRYVITQKKKEPPKDDGTGTAPAPPPEPKEAKKTTPMDNKVFACDFVASPPTAVCGTDAGLTQLGPWLRSQPRPKRGDLALEIYAAPMRETMLAAMNKKTENTSSLTAADPQADPETQRKKKEDELKAQTNLGDFIRELDGMRMSAALKGSELELDFATSFQGVESGWVKPLFLRPSGVAKPDLLFKLTENASAAFYSQGAGPIPDLLGSYDPWSELSGAEHDKAAAWTEDIKKLLMSPYGVAYGIDLPRVSAALEELAKAKEPDKAKKALAAAVDGYVLGAVTADVGTVQRLTREGIRLVDLEKKASAAQNPGTASAEKSLTTVRAAAPALALPRGSFFVDETKTVPGKTPKAPSKQEVKTSGLCFADGATTFMLFGLADDRTYAAIAKEIVSRKTAPRALDPLLTQKGIILGGQVTSLVGAFGSHELLLKDPGKMDKVSRDKLVADLQGDLAAPKLPIPFALSANREGAGGVLAFDVKGDKAAFATIFSHALEGMGALLMLPLMMAMMSATP